MFFNNSFSLDTFIIEVVVILLSLSFHEFAHAKVADYLGDDTPQRQGRLTINPLAHIDPLGFLAILILNFGWGKPVNINPLNFQKPYRDSAIVSIAGPLTNVTLALISTVILRLVGASLNNNGLLFLEFMIFLNLALAIFNLIPVPPLDGSKVLALFLPLQYRYNYESFLNKYSIFVILVLVLPIFNGQSVISMILGPIVTTIESYLI